MALSSLAQRVLRAVERDALMPPGACVLAACSGGGDSVALAALLCEIERETGWSVAGLLHVNHGLRGASADADEAHCQQLARELGVPIIVERVDVAARARRERISIETAGHRVRYELFERVVGQGTADLVATGHTRDDQAETLLLRLIRGAGPGGLAGIRPRIGVVVRPLLDIRRAELRGYLQQRGLSHREDASNRDERVLRNRVRHRLIPFLAEHFSPAITDVLARSAAIARDDGSWIDAAANATLERIVQCTEGGLDVDAELLTAEPAAIARRVARNALERAGDRRVGFGHVERLRRLAAGRNAPASADFPGCRVERHGTTLRLRRRPGRAAPEVVGIDRAFEYPLTVPGAVEIVETGLRIAAERGERPARLVAHGDVVALPAGRISSPLTVRSRRPGDVFRPLGLHGGSKKLQDFFVDRKVPRHRRGAVPLVVDARLGIVWVAGYAVSEGVRMIDTDEAVVTLKIVKTGGFA